MAPLLEFSHRGLAIDAGGMHHYHRFHEHRLWIERFKFLRRKKANPKLLQRKGL